MIIYKLLLALRAAITSQESLLCPVGGIIQYGGSSDTVPVGWLLCDGRSVSRSVYSNLFKKIGTFFGSGDGSTTFNLPDMRQVTPQGCGRNSRNFSGDDDVLSLGEIKENQLQEHTHPYLLASNRRQPCRLLSEMLSPSPGSCPNSHQAVLFQILTV